MAFAPNIGVKPCHVSSLPVATLGTPRIGPRRELKTALENYWSGKSDERALLRSRRRRCAPPIGRARSRSASRIIPSNDFSLYDHVLDTSVMVGAIPEIYGWKGGQVSLETYFAMARGAQGEAHRRSLLRIAITPITATACRRRK